MASKFFEGRKVVRADELRGPRVYSTDLLPSFFDARNPGASVAITARALKIKIISKGLVTLNSAHLISPLAVLLLDAHPDLFAGDAILPAFREDKSNLTDLVPIVGSLTAVGIDEARLRDHAARVEGLVKQLMPWKLSDAENDYRTAILGGLRNPQSLIVRQLTVTRGVEPRELERMAREIEGLDFENSANLRKYVSELPENMRESVRGFTTACYHKVGTNVVRCETGADLNPLSEFRAADMIFAARDAKAETLSNDAIFLEAFLGFALDTIQASVLPTQIIDSISFQTAHDLSGALRAQGFQEKYDKITDQYVATLSQGDPHEALDKLNEEAVASVASELAKIFRDQVLAELPDYETAIQSEAKAALYRSGTDIARDVVGVVPILSNVVAFADVVTHVGTAAGDAAQVMSVRDQEKAFAEAQKLRTEKISGAVHQLRTNDEKKTKLLDAVALLSDVHAIAVKRA